MLRNVLECSMLFVLSTAITIDVRKIEIYNRLRQQFYDLRCNVSFSISSPFSFNPRSLGNEKKELNILWNQGAVKV